MAARLFTNYDLGGFYDAIATGDREEAQRVRDEVEDLLRRPPPADRQVLRDLRRKATLYIEHECGTDNF